MERIGYSMRQNGKIAHRQTGSQTSCSPVIEDAKAARITVPMSVVAKLISHSNSRRKVA